MLLRFVKCISARWKQDHIYRVLHDATSHTEQHAWACVQSLYPNLMRTNRVAHTLPVIALMCTVTRDLHKLRNSVYREAMTATNAILKLEKICGSIHSLIAEIDGPTSVIDRRALGRLQIILLDALADLGQRDSPDSKATLRSTERQNTKPTMMVPSDFLQQWCTMLSPPERMAVMTGHRVNGSINLSRIFDVTGKGPETHAAHCKADPSLLHNALMNMENAGGSLAIWVHSHPGAGAGSTHPSNIDLEQQKDWLRHYPKELVFAIVNSDRYVRFWGPAVDQRLVHLQVVGDGVKEEAQHVYHLTY